MTDNKLFEKDEDFFKGLSIPLINILKNKNIRSVKDLMNISQEDIFKLRNIGPKRRQELELWYRKKLNIKPGTCKICGCTMYNPCYNPKFGFCWWINESNTICSHCSIPLLKNSPKTIHKVNDAPDFNISVPNNQQYFFYDEIIKCLKELIELNHYKDIFIRNLFHPAKKSRNNFNKNDEKYLGLLFDYLHNTSELCNNFIDFLTNQNIEINTFLIKLNIENFNYIYSLINDFETLKKSGIKKSYNIKTQFTCTAELSKISVSIKNTTQILNNILKIMEE